MKVKIEHAIEFYEWRVAIRTEAVKKSEAEWLAVKAKKSKSMSEWFDRFVCEYIVGKPYEYQPGLWSDWEYMNFRNDVRSLEHTKNNISGARYRKTVMGEKFHDIPDDFVHVFLKWWEEKKATEYQKLKDDCGLTDNI